MNEIGSIRLRLIQWNAAEAQARIELLEKAGFQAIHEALDGTNYRTIRRDAPDAFLIDLSRLPSHGREVALALREWKDTRRVPIVFLGGDESKVEKLRRTMPDAVFANWRGVSGAVKKAIRSAPDNPIVPRAQPGGYSGTPLPKKLGIKPGIRIFLIDPPDDFVETLGELPGGVTISKSAARQADLTIWFVRRRDELSRVVDIARRLGPGGLWIAWPKKSSGVKTDFAENDVRSAGLQAGLVDYKVCAIDATWSGLRFARRKSA